MRMSYVLNHLPSWHTSSDGRSHQRPPIDAGRCRLPEPASPSTKPPDSSRNIGERRFRDVEVGLRVPSVTASVAAGSRDSACCTGVSSSSSVASVWTRANRFRQPECLSSSIIGRRPRPVVAARVVTASLPSKAPSKRPQDAFPESTPPSPGLPKASRRACTPSREGISQIGREGSTGKAKLKWEGKS